MTKYEIRAAIRAKEKEKRELVHKSDKAYAAKDLEEMKKCNELIEALIDDIEALQEQLDKILEAEESDGFEGDEPNIPQNAEKQNADIRSAFLGGGSFAMATAKGHYSAAAKNVDSLALRSNESMVSRLPKSEQKHLDLGKYVRGAVTGNWNDAPEERAAFSTSTTGVLIPQVLSAEIVDNARAISLFTAAGVPVVPMETNNMTIARVKNDPVFAFKEELEEADESSFELEPVELKAKTAYGYAYVSLETLHSAKNLRDILFKVFSQALADMCDKGMLYGQNGDTFAPSGILNDAAINTIAAHNEYFDDFVKAIGKVKRANGVPTILGINAATDEEISLAKDANGRVLDMPPSMAALQRIVSNQLAEDENDGSDALVFDPLSMIIGIQNQMTFRMFQDTEYCIKNGAVGFQIYSMLDCVAVQPKHICKITGLKSIQTVSGE